MASSFTTNKVLEKPGNGDYVDTWNVPVNGDMDVIDQAFGGVTSLNATGGSATLTDTQYRSLVLSVSGAMSASVVYTIPSGKGGQWIVKNTTTDASGGPWTVTIASGGGGTSVVVSRNTSTLIYSDGTNIVLVNATILTPGSVGTTELSDGAVTYPKVNSSAIATGANFQANTASKLLDANGVWSSGALTALTDASTVAVDMSTGFNFSLTLGGSRTLGNPTNTKVGQSGVIVVTNPSTYTLGFGANYKFSGGAAPTITTSGTTVLSYFVVSSSFILIVALLGVA